MTIPEPHSAVRIRPGSSTDSTGATVSVYKGGTEVRKTITLLFQTRSGRFILVEEGVGYNLNAFGYTSETDVIIQDILILDLPGTKGNYQVMNVEPKYDLDGSFQYNKLSLQIEQGALV